MQQKVLLLAGVLCLGIASLSAQTQRADTASRTTTTLSRVDQATATPSDNAIGFKQQADSDLGEQQPVNLASGGFGAYLIADTSLTFTSNPSLASGGGQGDMYFMARGGAGIHPNLIGSLYLDAHISQEVYEYAHFSSLDFSRFNTGGGLDYVFEDFGQLTASVRYEYERFLDGRNYKEFYVNNAVTASLTKQFLINDVHAIQTGFQGSFSVAAEPFDAKRDAYDWWVGWRWRIKEPLELQTYYVVTLYDYVNQGRVDLTQNVGGSLSYYFTDWAKVSAAANFGANNSTDSYFDYTVVNVGGTLSLDLRF